MSGIDMDNPAWEKLIYLIDRIADLLEVMVDRQ